MNRFDLMNAPLAGINLLEAAAGTGKTYAIEGLYLRLIIEKSLPVAEILVVTYTVAATEELRDRIRKRLRAATVAFAQGRSSDPLLAGLLEKFPDLQERRRFRERLQAAIRDFDESAIYTIHSFCQRVLQENAFESDSFFDSELITDERVLREEIVADFWRNNFYETVPEVAGFALSRRFNPDYLGKLLGISVLRPNIRIIPEAAPPSLDAIKEKLSAYNGAFAGLIEIWPRIRDEVGAILSGPALHAGLYGRKVGRLMKEMDAFLSSRGPFFPLFDNFGKFTTQKIAEKVKKNHEPPGHDFFCLCQSLKDHADSLERSLDNYLLSLKTEFIGTAMRKLTARKERENLMFFDDLLSRLKEALQKRGGEELARIMRKKYRAALIDEFQDTDPVQFAIFETIFGQGEGEGEGEGAHPLFLIGDPKQAIYSFRGADIFAYMKAAKDIDGKYHIAENWRSEPGLIKATNALFSVSDNPFVYREISFLPARAPAVKDYDFLTLYGRREAPFQWWFMPAERHTDSGRPLSRERAEVIICRAVAGEIARLLDLSRHGAAMLGERPLKEEDIAILVRKHREARIIQEALRSRNIPSVLHKSGNIFDTREAEEMERIMTGVAMPGEEPLVRAALLTDALGLSVTDMGCLMTDEQGWGGWLERFGLYHRLWLESGFVGMFTAFMAKEGVKNRLLSLPDGERRITNLLHLAELIHREDEAQKLGITGLVKWLARQRDPATPRKDEHQLRLESDEKAVRVITIHQSKGLEYPVVFCPFTWEGSEMKGDIVSFHGSDGDEAITIDFGSEEVAMSRTRALREVLAENVRLLYVALTRAKNRCYFVWGRFNKADTSAPAYLFHYESRGKDAGEGDSLVHALSEGYRKLNDASLYRRIEEIASLAEGNISLGDMPDDAAGTEVPVPEEGASLLVRQFSGKVDRSWRIVSFSSLLSDLPHLAESPDYDGTVEGDATAGFAPILGVSGGKSIDDVSEAPDIFSFPRGARAGILLHDILRCHDFHETDVQAVKLLISRKLREKGFPSLWEETVIAMLKNVAAIPLLPFAATDIRKKPFTLADISLHARLNEMEFYFPLRRIASQDLENIFSRAGVPSAGIDKKGKGMAGQDFSLHLKRLQFSPARGFIKGFMDMVFCFGDKFYLVDWKSNFLGGKVSDYGEGALARSMRSSYYILQYHLYALALHQYLSACLPDYRYERHFGGVYYFFLRGIDPAYGPLYGIYRDRPEEGLIKEMQERLLDKVNHHT